MPVLLLVFAVIGFYGCEKKQESFDPSLERGLRSLSLHNYSSEKIFVEDIDLALSMKWGGYLSGRNRSTIISPRMGPLPSELDIYWKCANKRYHKKVKINLPIKDKRIFDGVTVNFDKNKCWLTYHYILGDIAKLNSWGVELDEDGALCEDMHYKIPIALYILESEVRDKIRKTIKDYEAKKNNEKSPMFKGEKL